MSCHMTTGEALEEKTGLVSHVGLWTGAERGKTHTLLHVEQLNFYWFKHIQTN